MTIDGSEYVPDEQRSMEIDLPEHQILLSFDGDDHAEAFLEWWNRYGVETFCTWVEAGQPLEVVSSIGAACVDAWREQEKIDNEE